MGMLKIRFDWYIIPCGELLVVVVLNTYAKFWEEIVFFTFLRVRVKDNNNSPYVKFHRLFYLVANFQT